MVYFLLIFFGIALGFSISFFWYRDHLSKLKNNFLETVDVMLALNISHLHDAANLFNLVCKETENKRIKNFTKGAAFHFRSLFNGLQNTLENFRESLKNNFNFDGEKFLLEKEDLDLKDLLENELFQLGNFERLELQDKTNCQHALIEGNFSLLTKVLLNLTENALQYTTKGVVVKLEENNNHWQITINSLGNAIPEITAETINKKLKKSFCGHGLDSLIDIMNYHNAETKILTLADTGSSIILLFPKLDSNLISLNTKPAAKSSNTTFYIVSLILILFIAGLVGINYFVSSRKLIVTPKLNKLDEIIDKKTADLALSEDL